MSHTARATLDMLAGDLNAATARWTAIEAVSHPINLSRGGVLVKRGDIDVSAHRPAASLCRVQQFLKGIDAASYRDWSGPILTTALRACADLAETARARRDTAGEQAAREAAQRHADFHDALPHDPFAPNPYHVTAPPKVRPGRRS
jgi:hypothetical protein